MARLIQRTSDVVKNRPSWVQLAGVAWIPVVGYGMAQRRGTAMGIMYVVCVAGVMLPAAIWQEGLQRWSRRHPVLGSGFAVPIFFASLAFLFPHLSLPWCLVVAVLIAAALGMIAALRSRSLTVPSGTAGPADVDS